MFSHWCFIGRSRGRKASFTILHRRSLVCFLTTYYLADTSIRRAVPSEGLPALRHGAGYIEISGHCLPVVHTVLRMETRAQARRVDDSRREAITPSLLHYVRPAAK